jgi:hypothetical protein
MERGKGECGDVIPPGRGCGLCESGKVVFGESGGNGPVVIRDYLGVGVRVGHDGLQDVVRFGSIACLVGGGVK